MTTLCCLVCGAEIGAHRKHMEWHSSLDLQTDLLRSIVEAQLKRIQKLEAVTPPPATGSAAGE